MRKAQAAMEFLMTYGWAILVVLAAIGALAYFGVLSPDKFLPSKCTTTPGFSCTEAAATAGTTGLLKWTLKNNLGSDLTDYSVQFKAASLTSTEAGGTACGDTSDEFAVTAAPNFAVSSAVLTGAQATQGGYQALRFVATGAATAGWKNSGINTFQIGAGTTPCNWQGKVKLDFTIFYTAPGGSIVQQAGGNIQGAVQ